MSTIGETVEIDGQFDSTLWAFEIWDRIFLAPGRMLPLEYAENYRRRAAVADHLHRHIFDLDADAINGHFERINNNAALQFLAQYPDDAHDLEIDVLREILTYWWVKPNLMAGPIGFSRQLALEFLERTGFISDGPLRPTVAVDLWQGLVRDIEPDADCPMGDTWDVLCWSAERSIAERFASGHTGQLYVARSVAPELVLARFDGRDEHEYVVDPMTVNWERVA